ncbi:MAG TPA: DUF5916 domain-containing protein, partial [Gemmatimonadales bacterium]|nr:DUF5916 domain-containing protein [Gemmatimonadales bacterium]
MLNLIGMLLVLQGDMPAPQSSGELAPVTATSVRATRAVVPPVLDGRDDDAVWQAAPVVDQFQMARPREGGEARYRTEAKVGYDPSHLYVFVRSFDPHPDSIISQLARRDEMPPSDYLILLLDSFHDRRTGYEFIVNPAGVKQDAAIYNDGNEDNAWDGVWDVATRVDSLGWTAEYRIPLSQLRYSSRGSGTFGILFWRVIQRHAETVTWPLWRQSKSGLPSQFGDLTGLDSLGTPGRGEFTPYLVAKNVEGPASKDYARDQQFSVGGDLRYRITSNIQLNATVNPDFGQVEADPSELNLSAFESFFSERRPFFVDGKGVFDFRVNCVVVVDCSTGEGLFYSRRIGRSPQLGGIYGNDNSATSTRILGAAKVTGRLPGGFNLGVLDAVTDHVSGPGKTTLEPTTNYAVVRGSQDYNQGNGTFGFMLTAVNRNLDASSRPYLHSNAYAGGLDARHRFNRSLEASASFSGSRVEGSEAVIAATQRDPVHLYQRPDGSLEFDSTRTSLSGTNLEVRFAKVGGRKLQFETAYQRRTPGFEINDLGFLQQADQQQWTSWANLAWRTPNKVFQQLRWNLNNWNYWNIDGLPTERAFNTNVHVQFVNNWWYHMGGTLGQVGETYCDRCARGGPAIRQDPFIAPWAGIEGDNRKTLVPFIWFNGFIGDRGNSWRYSLEPRLEAKVSSRFTTSLGTRYEHRVNNLQYFGTYEDDGTGQQHYTFANLDQHTLSMTWRLAYTFTPTASLQVYASPFITKGT